MNKYYLYTIFTQLRFTRIISMLFIVQVLHIGLVNFALLQSIFLFSQFSFELPSGILGDLFRKKNVILLGLLILMISPLLIYFSLFVRHYFVYSLLIIAFVLEGIGNALLSGADDALFYQSIREEGRLQQYSKIRGNIQLISSFFLGIATFTGGFMYSIHKLLPFVSQSMLLLMAACVIISVPSEKVNKYDDVKEVNKTLHDILAVFSLMTKSGNILFLFLFTTLVVSGVNALFSLLPQFISDLGFSSTSNGTVFMIYSLVGGIVATQAYRLEKFSIRNLVAIITGLLTLGVIFQLSGKSLLLLVSLGFIYVTVDILDPIVMAMLNSWVEDKARATFISGLSFLISLVTMIITPLMAIVLKKYNLIITSVLTAVIIALLSTFGYYILVSSKKNKKAI